MSTDGAKPSAEEWAAEPSDVLAVLSADMTVSVWTGAAERLWGYTADQVLHSPAGGLLVPGTPEIAGVLAGSPWSGRVRIRRRDGHEATVDLRVTPLSTDGGVGWLVWGPNTFGRPSLDPAAVDALFHHSPISLAIWDRGLRCVWFNDSVHNRDIYHSEPELGGHVTDMVRARHPEFLERAMERVFRNGLPLLGHELWPVKDQAPDRYYRVALIRLDGADGRPLGVCSAAVEADAGRESGRLRLLNEAKSRIGTDLDPLVTSQRLAETAVPDLADYVTIDLVQAVPMDKEPLRRLRSTDTSIPGFYRAGTASIHDDLRESLWARGTPVYVPPASPFTTVLKERRSHFEPVLDTSPGTWLDDDSDRARVIHLTGMHSLMIVPLQARGAMLGIAVLVRSQNPVPFSRADLALAEELAARAALIIDNALRYTRGRTAALAIQRDLMPHRLSGGNTVEVATRYLPADTQGGVGGDWFDVIQLSDARVALVVGDVVGHGVKAAVTMGRLRATIRAFSKVALPPDELLRLMDELAVDVARERSDEGTSTVPAFNATCLYGVYDPQSQRCTMASAGHPPPAIIFPDGSVEFVEVPPGAPIGVGLGSYESTEVELPDSSVIGLYSDGLIEGDHDIDRGLQRLRTALTGPVSSLDDLCTSVLDTLAPDGPADDDIALLLARTRSAADP
ncbi:MAG: SpoIIE family protein phosphatase [Streptomyces sp.]|uniref:SpoIIE family protein phosphatase n=1 Tax=Streptomyces sp. TaxID=1931 RepID=UPI0025DCDFA3|nr:SpoIIE family protein phosphatase [Streptomyces sp.]MBW8794823.1 SpoIIE family protein phosphatase [Streptomyces sp.]